MEQLVGAFLASLTETLADRIAEKVAERLLRKELEPTPEAPASNPEYLTPKQLAELLQVSEKNLGDMRAAGRGPKFFKVGRLVRYRRDDIEWPG
jgi:hypothetical protein